MSVHVGNAPTAKTTELSGGRGPHTYNTDTVYFISENRNSDDIVVYVGTADISGNPDDGCWENAKYFKYNEHYQAADWIMSDIIERINAQLVIEAEAKAAEYSETFGDHMAAANAVTETEPEMTAEQLAELIGKIRRTINVQEVNLIIKDLPDNIKKALNNVKRF